MRDLMTPSHMVLNSVKVKVKPESFFFSVRKMKKSEWQGQESKGGGELAGSSSAPGKTA
jgi:hypothetical protein